MSKRKNRYQRLLKSPKWQRRRLEVFERDAWCCQSCGATEDELHVHHFAYTGKNPWDAPDADLVTVCAACHAKVHTDAPMRWDISVWERWRNRFYGEKPNSQEAA